MREKHFRRPWWRQQPDGIFCIDSHTDGEATRLVLGFEDIEGCSMADKRAFLMQRQDHVRRILTREPRGNGVLAAVVTHPVSKEADFGLIYMDGRRYPYLCGHAAIGAVTTLIETGMLSAEGRQQRVVVDTPSGALHTTAFIEDRKVKQVAIRMVPSFVYRTDQRIQVPEFGELHVDLVCVGGFFAMVHAQQLPMSLSLDNSAALKTLGMRIIEAANQQLSVCHPTRNDVRTVDVVEFYREDHSAKAKGRSMVIYGEAHMDRSPCGTGTSAKMTLLHHRGQLALNQPYVNISPLGTQFEGLLVEACMLAQTPAVVAEIRGSAYTTGIHEFFVDAADPFPEGFML